MKKIITINISHFSFNIEEDAYQITNQYLDKLRHHYGDKEHGKEITDSIEERMAELFTERLGHTKIITISMAHEVMAILGDPIEIDPNYEGDDPQEETEKVKKQFFRNVKEGKLGGVLAGIAVYIGQDITMVRLIFTGLFLLFLFTFINGSGAMILGYLVLWLIVPPANTVSRRCAMHGESLHIENIKKKIEEGAQQFSKEIKEMRSPIGDKLGRTLELVFGIILLCLSILGITAIGTTLLGFQYYGALQTIFHFSSWLTVALILAISLPFIGWMYGSILLLFKLKAPRWKPGVILFIIWILAIITSIPLTVGNSVKYWDTDKMQQTTSLSQPSDTLYLVLEGCEQYENDYIYLNGTRHQFSLLFINKSKGEANIVSYPKIAINRLDSAQMSNGLGARIDASTHLFTKALSLGDWKAAQNLNFYSIQGDTISIKPLIYSTLHENNEINRRLNMYIPSNTTVIIEEPIQHQFDKNFNYSNFWNF